MQRNELNLFYEENRETIQRIKNNLHQVYQEEPSLCHDLHPFCQFRNPDGRKSFIFLCAALLKDNVNYEQLYKAIDYLLIRYKTSNTFLGISSENPNDYPTKNKLAKQVMHEAYLMPLLAYSVCSYANMQSWYDTHKISEPSNPYIQIIKRATLYHAFQDLYSYEEWNANAGETNILAAQNQFLNIITAYAQPYPHLMDEIKPLLAVCFQVEYHDYYVKSPTEHLQKILLIINNHHLRMLNPLSSTLASETSISGPRYNTHLNFFNVHETCGASSNPAEDDAWNACTKENNINRPSGPGYGF